MSTIVLREVAITDLSIRYARQIDEKKIRQYVIPYAHAALSDKKPLDLIKEFILKEENKESSELEFVVKANASLVVPTVNGTLQIEDVSSILDDDLKKTLLKQSFKRLINPIGSYRFFYKIVNFLAKILNPIIYSANRFLQKLQKLEYMLDRKGFFIPSIYVRSPHVVYHFAKFITVGFEVPDYKKAQESLLNDLRILNKHDLILGYLAKPSLMALADVVGTSIQHCVLFCFPVIDQVKLSKLIGSTSEEKQVLKKLGVVNETTEGTINWLDGISPEQKYEIEVVKVLTQPTREETDKAVMSAFEASIPSVNKAAELTRRLIKQFPEELAKAEKELNAAVESAHAKAIKAARLKAAKSLSKRKTKKKPSKKKPAKRKKKAVKRK